jgi:hypothetical protein
MRQHQRVGINPDVDQTCLTESSGTRLPGPGLTLTWHRAGVVAAVNNNFASRSGGSRPGRHVNTYTPRHARHARKRHPATGLEVANTTCAVLTVLLS